MTSTSLQGLTSEEVKRLTEEGKINQSKSKAGKSYLRIFFENIVTFFNLIWLIITVALLAVESYNNMTYLFVIIPNILIALISEIKAKMTVSHLSVTTDPKATVIRDGVRKDVPASKIVLGDLVVYESGRQILADGEVVEGLAEANESMLTGESNAIRKDPGCRVLAGSFLVSGCITVKVDAVGEENYVNKLERKARKFKKPASNLFRSMDKLIKYISIIIVPLAIALFFVNRRNYPGEAVFLSASKDAIAKTCGAIGGMIPAGVYLLITVTLTLSVIKLAKKRTLVQDRYSIEMLARTDVICLDKTGTITDGTMFVKETILLSDMPEAEIGEILAYLEGAEHSINKTARAIIRRYGKKTDRKIDACIPFSSERKFSAAIIDGLGIYSIGAPHFVPCPITEEMEAAIKLHADRGERVLLLCKHGKIIDATPEDPTPLALLCITDRIRPNAKETIQMFQEQGVAVKIISGDHAATVASIASRVGVKHAERYISCENISDEDLAAAADKYTVFGRVTPEQKVLLIKTLKAAGHTVAMTGDGVNDTLALKKADCAIAMAEGSEVARKVSQIVLLDSDFSSLPDVVKEGRRCINNVAQSTSLFLMKTVFVVLLSFITAITATAYPFEPRNVFILETFIIGIAAFLLAFEPNYKRIEHRFLTTVMVKSIPRGLALLIPVLLTVFIGRFFKIDDEIVTSVGTYILIVVGIINLCCICLPFTKWRLISIGITLGLVTFAILGNFTFFDWIGIKDWFVLMPAFMRKGFFTIMLSFAVVVTGFISYFTVYIEKWLAAFFEKQANNPASPFAEE